MKLTINEWLKRGLKVPLKSKNLTIKSVTLMGQQNFGCHKCQSHKNIKHCERCQVYTCQKCIDYPVLKPFKGEFSLNDIEYYSACISCFLKQTDLDFTRVNQIVGDENQKQLIFIHGAGSSRKLFLPHARELANKGFRSILIDLPGHGARYDEDLTIDACVQAIKEAIQLCRTKDFTILGASLGGYILMEFIGREPDLRAKAVVLMSGQDVGVNRGAMASLGLWAMGKAFSFMSQATVAKKFMQSAANNKHMNAQMIKDLSTCGVYFKHSQQNIVLLKETNPRLSLEQAKGKWRCLFINGENDHRNSENIWLQAIGGESRLLVYEGGDHFFSHDDRFFQRLIDDISKFAQEA